MSKLTADDIADLGRWHFIQFKDEATAQAAMDRYRRFVERQRERAEGVSELDQSEADARAEADARTEAEVEAEETRPDLSELAELLGPQVLDPGIDPTDADEGDESADDEERRAA